MVIHELFEAQVERTGDNIAVISGNKQTSYYELNQKANQLAHYLISLGIKPGMLVGIYMQRSLELIISMLGVMKVGGIYLLLEPSYPRARLDFMLTDSETSLVLVQEKFLPNLSENVKNVVCMDTKWEVISEQSFKNLGYDGSIMSLAAVFYTSGSTGNPKGVLL